MNILQKEVEVTHQKKNETQWAQYQIINQNQQQLVQTQITPMTVGEESFSVPLPGWEADLETAEVATAAFAVLLVMLWRFLTAAIAPRKVSGGKPNALYTNLFQSRLPLNNVNHEQHLKTWGSWCINQIQSIQARKLCNSTTHAEIKNPTKPLTTPKLHRHTLSHAFWSVASQITSRHSRQEMEVNEHINMCTHTYIHTHRRQIKKSHL